MSLHIIKDDDSSAESKALTRAVNDLGEHWESVQIVVSRYDPATGETVSTARGTGNFHARLGSVRHWVSEMDLKDQMISEEKIRDEIFPEDDDEG